MPKATPSQATEGSFGIQEGPVRVEDATFRTYQMSQNKKTGDTYAPFPALVLKLRRLGDDGEPEGEPDEQPFGCGKIDKFAVTDDADMNTPADDYQEAETEGRYIMALNAGTTFNKSSKYIQLNNSLIAKGFRSDLLDECDARVYIGLEGVIRQDKQKGSDGKEYKVTVFDKITRFPYDKKGKATAPPAKKKAAADDDDTEDDAPKTTSRFDPDAAAEKLLKKLVKAYRKKDIDAVPAKTLRRDATKEILDEDPEGNIDPKKWCAEGGPRDKVVAKFEDVDFLKGLADDLGFTVKRDGSLAIEEA